MIIKLAALLAAVAPAAAEITRAQSANAFSRLIFSGAIPERAQRRKVKGFVELCLSRGAQCGEEVKYPPFVRSQ